MRRILWALFAVALAVVAAGAVALRLRPVQDAIITRIAERRIGRTQANDVVGIMETAAREAGESRIAKILADIPSYHTTPADAAGEAVAAGVRLLVLTHFTPPPDNALLARVFRRDVKGTPPRGLVLGEDGTLIVLPAGSDAVDVTRLDP